MDRITNILQIEPYLRDRYKIRDEIEIWIFSSTIESALNDEYLFKISYNRCQTGTNEDLFERSNKLRIF